MTFPTRLPRLIAKANWISMASLFALVLLSVSAQAQDQTVPEDEIVLTLSERVWVEAEKARVVAIVDTAMDANASENLQADVAKALNGLADGVDWKMTGFSRHADQAGLERWHVTAEGRLTDQQLAGLEARAKTASRPGLQVRIGQVSFQPSREEMEAAGQGLRKAIYARVVEELALVKGVIPDRAFRVGRVDFLNRPLPVPARRAHAQKMTLDSAVTAEVSRPAAQGLSNGRELVLRATVSLVASAP